MEMKTPESMGLSSAVIERYLRSLDADHLATHDVIIARGDSILFETYIPPFRGEDTHRMYSVTKSFVSLAVGFALDEGLLSLDDPMDKYFHQELEGQTDEYLRYQTVRQMLMMSTAKPCQNWFAARTDDRVRYYFQNPLPSRVPGEKFDYDSTGTFVIGALIERLTGKKLAVYLREKLFDKIGVSEKAHFLTCPGGHTWGDSAALMLPRDLLLIARFVLNGGSWNGEQLISAGYIKDATSTLIENDTGKGMISDQGYGYYIWKSFGNEFFFYGMGCQFALCIPDKDLILIYNGDNQGRDSEAMKTILHGFRDIVASAVTDSALPEDPAAAKSLADYAASMKLMAAWETCTPTVKEKMLGCTYALDENPMGMKSFCFTEENGVLHWHYVNAQGEKDLAFGMNENVLGLFPQTGYSTFVGSQPGHRLYRCAVSGAWCAEDTLRIKVQVIDDYFGNFDAYFRFSPDGEQVEITMKKTAEDFFDEYSGEAKGHKTV